MRDKPTVFTIMENFYDLIEHFVGAGDHAIIDPTPVYKLAQQTDLADLKSKQLDVTDVLNSVEFYEELLNFIELINPEVLEDAIAAHKAKCKLKESVNA